MEKPRRHIQSVSRAIAILEAVGENSQGFRLKELSEALSLPCQTVQSLLRTLQYHGYVIQSGRGAAYRLGPALHALAWKSGAGRDRAALFLPLVETCCEKLSENVVLSELHGNVLMPLAECRVDRELSVAPTTLIRDTLHLRANGKVLLAFAEDAVRDTILEAADFSAGTENAAHNANALREQLSLVRASGVARCRDEAAAGISALAVGVVDASGRVWAALGCNLPSARLDRERESQLVDGLRRMAERLSHTHHNGGSGKNPPRQRG